MPTVLYHFHNLYIETIRQANYALKTESVKNRIVSNDLNYAHTSATLKILKNYDNVGNLYINHV